MCACIMLNFSLLLYFALNTCMLFFFPCNVETCLAWFGSPCKRVVFGFQHANFQVVMRNAYSRITTFLVVHSFCYFCHLTLL